MSTTSSSISTVVLLLLHGHSSERVHLAQGKDPISKRFRKGRAGGTVGVGCCVVRHGVVVVVVTTKRINEHVEMEEKKNTPRRVLQIE